MIADAQDSELILPGNGFQVDHALLGVRGRVFASVVHQVEKDLLNRGGIGSNDGAAGRIVRIFPQGHVRLLGTLDEARSGAVNQSTQRNALDAEAGAPAFEAGESEDILDEVTQSVGFNR